MDQYKDGAIYVRLEIGQKTIYAYSIHIYKQLKLL